eukprot:gb/GECH01006979.1/.p1 GENE.gb/GECH01006979.1/~~gb/GECH01006979.1/.p1  ORF type:complete len:1121 (+),score=391.23 gb/GECH01006979.1/:1-3363(+)
MMKKHVQPSSPSQCSNSSIISSSSPQISNSNVTTPNSNSSFEVQYSLNQNNHNNQQVSFQIENEPTQKTPKKSPWSIPELKKEATMCNATTVLKFGLGKEPDIRRRLEMGCFLRSWAGTSKGSIPVENWILIATDYYNTYDCDKAREMVGHAFMLTLSEIQEWSRKYKKVNWNASEKSISHSSRWLSAMLIATKQIVNDLPDASRRIIEGVLCEAKIYSRRGENETAQKLFEKLVQTVHDLVRICEKNNHKLSEFQPELVALNGQIKHQFALHYVRIRDNRRAETLALDSRAQYLTLESQSSSTCKELGVVLNTLAYSMLCQGKTHPAHEFVSESIHRRSSQNILPVSGYHQLGLLYQTQQNWELAESFLWRAINLRLEHFASQAVHIAQTYLNLAELYLDKDGPLTKAEEYFKESETYFNKVGHEIPPEHWDVYRRVDSTIEERKKEEIFPICGDDISTDLIDNDIPSLLPLQDENSSPEKQEDNELNLSKYSFELQSELATNNNNNSNIKNQNIETEKNIHQDVKNEEEKSKNDNINNDKNNDNEMKEGEEEEVSGSESDEWEYEEYVDQEKVKQLEEKLESLNQEKQKVFAMFKQALGAQKKEQEKIEKEKKTNSNQNQLTINTRSSQSSSREESNKSPSTAPSSTSSASKYTISSSSSPPPSTYSSRESPRSPPIPPYSRSQPPRPPPPLLSSERSRGSPMDYDSKRGFDESPRRSGENSPPPDWPFRGSNEAYAPPHQYGRSGYGYQGYRQGDEPLPPPIYPGTSPPPPPPKSPGGSGGTSNASNIGGGEEGGGGPPPYPRGSHVHPPPPGMMPPQMYPSFQPPGGFLHRRHPPPPRHRHHHNQFPPPRGVGPPPVPPAANPPPPPSAAAPPMMSPPPPAGMMPSSPSHHHRPPPPPPPHPHRNRRHPPTSSSRHHHRRGPPPSNSQSSLNRNNTNNNNNSSLRITLNNETVLVLETDITAQNGVIHIIDTVLNPQDSPPIDDDQDPEEDSIICRDSSNGYIIIESGADCPSNEEGGNNDDQRSSYRRAEINGENFVSAIQFTVECLGAPSTVNIESWNGDSFESTCIALYTGPPSPTGNEGSQNAAISVIPCDNEEPTLCQRQSDQNDENENNN